MRICGSALIRVMITWYSGEFSLSVLILRTISISWTRECGGSRNSTAEELFLKALSFRKGRDLGKFHILERWPSVRRGKSSSSTLWSGKSWSSTRKGKLSTPLGWILMACRSEAPAMRL